MNRKKIEKILAVLCGVILLGVLRPTAVSAAVCTVSVTSATGYVGEEITVTCSVNQFVTAATIAVSYDPSCLEFKSASGGNSKGGGGRILLDMDISEENGIKVSYTIKFRALKASTSQVVVLPGQSDVVDAKCENYELDCGSATVTVKNHSSDASLRSLAVSPGTLSPDFSADRLRYTVRVGNSVRSLAVEAAVRDAEASVSVSGNRNSLSVGENYITVTVTAGDGTKREYVITVIREAAAIVIPPDISQNDSEQESKPEEPVNIAVVNGKEYEIASFEDEAIPSGFEATELTYKEATVPAIRHKKTELTAAWLRGDETLPTGFYWFDAETGEATPMTELTGQARIWVLSMLAPEQVPQGYELVEAELPCGKTMVFAPSGEAEPAFYLVYALNQTSGETGLYIFDRAEETLQRSGLVPVKETEESQPEPEGESSQEESGSAVPKPEDETMPFLRTCLLAGAGAVGVLLLFLVVIQAIQLSQNRRRMEEQEHQLRQMKRRLEKKTVSDETRQKPAPVEAIAAKPVETVEPVESGRPPKEEAKNEKTEKPAETKAAMNADEVEAYLRDFLAHEKRSHRESGEGKE